MTALPDTGVHIPADVLAAQRTFRALMNALSRPGLLAALPEGPADVPPGVDRHAALIAFTLLDHEVRFAAWGPRSQSFTDYVVRKTGARPAPAEEAGFLFAGGGDPAAPVALLPTGTLEFPEEGGTAVLTVEHLSADDLDGAVLSLTGAGVASAARVAVRGLADEALDAFMELNREYPLGIDAYLVDEGGRVLGLPRTVRILREDR
jgi:alpha-D-ribose 1-methylphosphonate 5-triphosphate synthase subunit PhnH